MAKVLRQLRGFTLIELAIVLVVVGMVAGAVVAGKQVMHQAKLKSVVDEVESIKQAVETFRTTYNALPGDMADAADRLGGGVTTKNGDGNGAIEAAASNGTNETLALWQHLALAGLIPGTFDGVTAQPEIGIKSAGYDKNVVYEVSVTPTGAVLVAASRYTTAGGVGQAFLSPEDAWSIDKKFDDGNPTTGYVIAADGTNASGACVVAGAYDLANKGSACRLDVRVKSESTTTAGLPGASSSSGGVGTVVGGVGASSSSGGLADKCTFVDTNGTATFLTVGQTMPGQPCPTEGMDGQLTLVCKQGGVLEADNGGTTCAYVDCPAAVRKDISGNSVSLPSTPVGDIATPNCPIGLEPVDEYGNYDNSLSTNTKSGCQGTAGLRMACLTPGGKDFSGDGTPDEDGWDANGNKLIGKCVDARCCETQYDIDGNQKDVASDYTVTMPFSVSGKTITAKCPQKFDSVGVKGGLSATCTKGTWANFVHDCDPKDCSPAPEGLTNVATTNDALLASLPANKKTVNFPAEALTGTTYSRVVEKHCPTWNAAGTVFADGTGPYGYSGKLKKTCNLGEWGALEESTAPGTFRCSPKSCLAGQVMNCGSVNCTINDANGHTATLTKTTGTNPCAAGYGPQSGGTITFRCEWGQWVRTGGQCYKKCGGRFHGDTWTTAPSCPCGVCGNESWQCSNGSEVKTGGGNCCGCPEPDPEPSSSGGSGGSSGGSSSSSGGSSSSSSSSSSSGGGGRCNTCASCCGCGGPCLCGCCFGCGGSR